MIVLGRKYKFTQLELKRLAKKNIVLNTVVYRDVPSKDVLQEISKLLKNKKRKVIVLNTKATVNNEIIKFLTRVQLKRKIQIITIETFLEKYLHKCYIPEDHTDLHYLQDIKPFNFFQYMQKRTLDYVFILFTLILTTPILIYARIKIKKESPGTSMFKQLRMGKNNKEFKCIKFRSMILDAEKDGAQFASQNDPRVFKWGETMRKLRIDELPQLLNVLKGEMHFIGPRPERKHWIEQFEQEIPYYNQRHIVKPGITGWAQVMYPYGANAEDAKQKLMYDLYYIKHWNILLELKVVWKTILVVLGKKGI